MKNSVEFHFQDVFKAFIFINISSSKGLNENLKSLKRSGISFNSIIDH